MRLASARDVRRASSLALSVALAGGFGCAGGEARERTGAGGAGAASGAATTGGSAGSSPSTGGHAGDARNPNTAGRAATGGAAATGGTSASGGISATGGTPTTGGAGAGGSGGSVGNAGGGSGRAGSANGGNASAGEGGNGEGARAGAGAAGVAGAPLGGAGGTGSWPTGDDFEGTMLDESWTVFRPDLADVELEDGALLITPKPNDLWYQASQGVLVYKLVTGDFKITATVHARKASDRNTPPMQFADVGGLMARNPAGSSENYVLGVVGYAEMNQLAVEHKSTTNSKSVYGETAFAADAELRLCRSAGTFTIYYRHPGDTGWPTSVTPIDRDDLPETLQVGLVAYTGASTPDYISIFDSVTFEPLGNACDE